MPDSLRVIFAGTPDFAAASLAALLGHPGISVIAVYTQPDKPAGRGQKLRESAVKQLALAHQLPVLQPDSLKRPEHIETFRALDGDLLVVAAFGQLLPLAILEGTHLGAINVHASLLPRWRGAAPIQRALMAGDEATGITIMRVVEKLDAGPMLLKKSCPIDPSDTGGSLHDRLALLGGTALLESIDLMRAGKAEAVIQDERLVTYARKIERVDREIDWSRPAREIELKIRALNPFPLATSSFNGLGINIAEARLDPTLDDLAPGALRLGTQALHVGTGDVALSLQTVQPAGKGRLSIREFLNGYRQRLQT